jgi:hypothetical protein
MKWLTVVPFIVSGGGEGDPQMSSSENMQRPCGKLLGVMSHFGVLTSDTH